MKKAALHQMESGVALNILTYRHNQHRQKDNYQTQALISISQQNPNTHAASISIYLFHSRGGGAGQKGPCHNQKLV